MASFCPAYIVVIDENEEEAFSTLHLQQPEEITNSFSCTILYYSDDESLNNTHPLSVCV